MPYLPHLKTTFIGKRAVTAASEPLETWSISLRWGIVGAGSFADVGQAQSNSVAAACLPAAATLFGKSWHDASSHFVEARTYVIGETGRAVGSIGVAVPAAPTSGSQTGRRFPWQTACVVTLAAEGRGVGKFGRVYLPGPTQAVTDTGQMQLTDAATMVADFKTFLTTLDTALGSALTADIQLVVAGRTGEGTLRPVRQLRVGRVLDTQRRRRRSVPEAPAVTSYGT